jgi:tripartite-type tricarboxylate transporter receptor subunit TctC
MKFLLSYLAASLLVLCTAGASAQDYPTRPITMIVPVPAGGAMDTSARRVGKLLGEKLGQPIVVENKPGAGGIVGAEYVVGAKPDGYTIMYNVHAVLVTYPLVFKKLSFDPQTALTAVRVLGETPTMLMVRADSNHKTLADFINHARKNPEKTNYGTAGTGSIQQLAGELFQREADIRMTAIPYKGAAPSITDLLGGTIDMIFDFASTMKPMIEAGKMRALATTGSRRLASLPDVPTFAEAGYPGMDLVVGSVIVAPAGVPRPIVDKLSDALGKTLAEPIIVEAFAEAGSTPLKDMDKEKLTSWLAAKKTKEKEIIERAGIQPE